MDLSPSSLRRDDGPDPAIMLFGKRIQGPFTTGAAEIKERVLSPCGVDEQGVSFNGTTSSDEEENHSSSNPSVGTVAAAGKEVEQAGGKAKAMGSETAGEKAKAAEMMLARCPRCHSADTKFCYFNNYNVNQPRHFCKHCQRYWTAGGTLRNVPVGAGKRKSKQSVRQAFPAPVPADDHSQPTNNNHRPFLRSVNTNLDLFAAGAQPNLHSGFSTEIRAPLPNLQFEPTELCIINRRNPQSGFLGLDDINANPQSGLGKISPNLQIEFSVLREINTNLQSGFSRLGEIKANLQSGCSGLGIINANLESGFPGLGGIKANLQTGFHGLTEIEANLQSGFSGSGQNKANLQSEFSRLGEHNANLHIGRPEAKAFKLNSQSESHESSEMKDQVQASTSENKPSGCSVSRESNAHLTGEYNGFSRIKAPQVCFYRDEPHKTPHLCFPGDEPHLSLCSSEFTPVKSTDEGAFNKNSLLEKVSCHEAREGWCSGEVLPIVGAQWPCFYNMYWVDGMPQEALRAWPHFAPLLTPQGWGMSCVGAMTPSIVAAVAAAAAPTATMKVLTATTAATTTTVTTTPPTPMLATHATIVAPNTTRAPPPTPIAMLVATHLNPPNTTSAPPPPTMVATHLNLTDDAVATTILGKRNAQHESMEEHDGFFYNYKSSKVCDRVEPSTTSSSSSNLITPGLITAIAQASNSGGLNFWQ